MNSGSSAFIFSASHSSLAPDIASWYQKSRPSCISQASSVTLTTRQLSIVGQFFRASSEMLFSGMALPARRETLHVISILQSLSFTRPLIASELNPPKMIEWMAPIRVHASIATTSSGTIPM